MAPDLPGEPRLFQDRKKKSLIIIVTDVEREVAVEVPLQGIVIERDPGRGVEVQDVTIGAQEDLDPDPCLLTHLFMSVGRGSSRLRR